MEASATADKFRPPLQNPAQNPKPCAWRARSNCSARRRPPARHRVSTIACADARPKSKNAAEPCAAPAPPQICAGANTLCAMPRKNLPTHSLAKPPKRWTWTKRPAGSTARPAIGIWPEFPPHFSSHAPYPAPSRGRKPSPRFPEAPAATSPNAHRARARKGFSLASDFALWFNIATFS